MNMAHKQGTVDEGMSVWKKLLSQREIGVFFALVIMVALVTVFSEGGTFMTGSNIINILRSVSTNGIIAIGMTFVILTGGIDLSVGSTLALSGAFAALTYNSTGSSGLAFLVCLATGLVVGLFNGIMVARFNVPPFIQTLVTMTAARGITFIVTNGTPVGRVGAFITFFGRGTLLGVPVPIVLMLLAFVVGWFLLTQTTLGRYTYAIGGSEECTKLSGVNVPYYKALAYVIAGLTASIGSLILIARLNSAQPSMGDKFEMDAIAAVVIGGTSLAGGSGTIIGTFIGTLILGVLMNGMNMLGVDSFAQYVVKGGVILFAVLLETRKKGR